ncbi:hypothetical protein ISS08_02220 [Candidatus Pacearchaeota archaeon]|nr:hypothetical protein [Candidatus Pacearchaeota archaeon]
MDIIDRSFVGFENLLDYLQKKDLNRIEGKCVPFVLPHNYEINPQVLGEFPKLDGDREFYFFEKEGDLYVNVGRENNVDIIPLREGFRSKLHLHTHSDFSCPSIEDIEIIERIGHGANYGVLSSEHIVSFCSPIGYNSDDIFGDFDIFLSKRKISHYSVFGLISSKKNWTSLEQEEKHDLVRDFLVQLGVIKDVCSLESVESGTLLDKFFKFSP